METVFNCVWQMHLLQEDSNQDSGDEAQVYSQQVLAVGLILLHFYGERMNQSVAIKLKPIIW